MRRRGVLEDDLAAPGVYEVLPSVRRLAGEPDVPGEMVFARPAGEASRIEHHQLRGRARHGVSQVASGRVDALGGGDEGIRRQADSRQELRFHGSDDPGGVHMDANLASEHRYSVVELTIADVCGT